MNPLLPLLRAEFFQKLDRVKHTVKRRVRLLEMPGKVRVIAGIRRCGKTTWALQLIAQWLADGVLPEQILYLNFEDDRLTPCDVHLLRSLVDDFYALDPANHQRTCYLVFDEIQVVDGWELLLRRLLDTRDIHMVVTGSSAKLLSKEIATSLRGRAILTEMWPYDFSEFLEARGVSLSGMGSQEALDSERQYLKLYLELGGFPEVVVDGAHHRQVLSDYLHVATLRDIIDRHRIGKSVLIHRLITILLKDSGRLFSVNKCFQDLKSQGFQLGRQTLYDYLDYIEDAYLAFSVPLYSESVRQQWRNPRKIYAVDTGLSHIQHFSLLENLGHYFENAVYLQLRRHNHAIYYYLTAERYEVDFLTQSPTGERRLYQVTWDCQNPKTLARETRALEQASQELGVEGVLVTPDNWRELLL